MNSNQIVAQPTNTIHNPSIPVMGVELGLLAVTIVSMLVTIVKGTQKSWEANQEIIDDLRKRCDDLEEKLADSEIKNIKLSRRNKSLENALDYSDSLNHSTYIGERENVGAGQN